MDEQERVINRDATVRLRRLYGRRVNGRNLAPDALWLMRQPVRGVGPENQPAKLWSLPDLGGCEIGALALRAHGYGIKAVEKRLGINRSSYRYFLQRNCLETKVAAPTQKAGRKLSELWTGYVDAEINAQRRQERAYTQALGAWGRRTQMERYYDDIVASRARSAESARKHFKRRRLNPLWLLKRATRTRIWRHLKGKCKSERTSRVRNLLGCDMQWYVVYLESLFRPGMTWANYGTAWEVDHIQPINTFDLSSVEQQRAAFGWRNTWPCWSEHNRRRPKDGSDILTTPGGQRYVACALLPPPSPGGGVKNFFPFGY